MNELVKVDARKLKGQRLEMALEAKQMREFGWSQPKIAKALKIPQRTISNWLKLVANNGNGEYAKSFLISNNNEYIISNDITLYPTVYETAAAHADIIKQPGWLSAGISSQIKTSGCANPRNLLCRVC